jgi:Xaa-Pro aminopeptidase
VDYETALDAVAETVGPPLDLGTASPGYPDFPLEEYRRRYACLAALMDLLDLEAMVLTQEEPIKYLSGYNSVIWAVGRWLPGAMLVTRDPRDAVLIPSAFDVGAVAGTSWVPNVDGHADPSEIPVKLGAHLDRLGADLSKVAVENGQGSIVMLPYPAARDLMSLVPDDAPDASRVMSVLRLQKSALEVERVRKIVSATVAGYRAGLEGARIGMTEKDIVALVAQGIYANGGTAGTRPLFLNAVAGPDRYPLVDAAASDRVLREGDVMFLDGGAGGDGYMSDIIRLLAFGDITGDQERFATVAARATRAMVDAARPGAKASQVYGAGQEVFESEGLGEHGGALSGHGIGLELWERPFLRVHDDPDEDIALRPGMTLCLEPILAPPDDSGGLAGIFVFEQQVLITDQGNEVLSGSLDAELWRVA